jgi:uncharacterized Zn-finger protein
MSVLLFTGRDDGFVCAECGKRYKSKQGLSDHTSQIHGSARHTCGQCGKKFATKTLFRSHILLHAGVRVETFKLILHAINKKLLTESGRVVVWSTSC